MSFIEIPHILSAINKFKNDILKILKIISVLGFICFSSYYCYLIIEHINNIVNIIVYSLLFIVVIITFITEQAFKNMSYQNRREKRDKYERKVIIGRITKIVKYFSKGITILIAMIGLLDQEYLSIMSLFTLISGVILLVQILFEVIIYFVCKYIDYLKIAFELDKDNSFIFNLSKTRKAEKLEKKLFELKGDSYYTRQEQKIIAELKKEVEIFKKEEEQRKEYKKRELKERIKNTKIQIKELSKKKLTSKRKEEIDEKYKLILAKSNDILSNSNDLDKLLIKVEKMIDKLPKEVETLKYIPVFISMINNYVTKKYIDISLEFILSVIAVIAYIASPFDIIPDFIPGIGYLDEAYLIGKCIDKFEDELTKFLIWRDNSSD